MARPEKERVVAELAAKLTEYPGAIVTDYRGLPVKAMADLRRELRGAGAHYLVVKNTLMRRAADQAGVSDLSQALAGPSAILFTPQDAGPAAKALLAFARQHGLPQVRAVMMSGKLYPAESAQDLATLPGREVMLSLVVGSFQGPVAALVSTLQGILGELASTLQALAQQRESAAA